jgi:hypothetical protein
MSVLGVDKLDGRVQVKFIKTNYFEKISNLKIQGSYGNANWIYCFRSLQNKTKQYNAKESKSENYIFRVIKTQHDYNIHRKPLLCSKASIKRRFTSTGILPIIRCFKRSGYPLNGTARCGTLPSTSTRTTSDGITDLFSVSTQKSFKRRSIFLIASFCDNLGAIVIFDFYFFDLELN